MSNTITIDQFKALNKKGKIGGKKKGGDKSRNEFFSNLSFWCDQKGLNWATEWQFTAERKFRFDFCIPKLNVGIEWEGVMSEHSYHTEVKGYTQNCSKYNLAQIKGWKVLRYTVLNKSEVFVDLEKLLKP